MICGPPATPFPNGLLFPRMAKVISRMVCDFRAWRKLFPEWFVISALGESHFLNGLAFPRMAKVISRKVWCFRAWRKSFPEWFEAFAARGNVREKLGCVCCSLSLIPYNISCFIIASIYLLEDFLWHG